MRRSALAAALLAAFAMPADAQLFAPAPTTTAGQISGNPPPGLIYNDATGTLYSLNRSYYGPMLFGTGKDGALTCTSAMTLTADVHYTNLTIQSGCAISPNGFRIFVSGTLDLSAAPAGALVANGVTSSNGSGATGGAATTGVSSGKRLAVVPTTSAGGTGTTTTGGAAPAASSFQFVEGGSGGTGGTGGTAGANTAGAGAAGTPSVNPQLFAEPEYAFVGYTSTQTLYGIIPGAPAGGGGAGAGDGTNAGGGGAGAAQGGGWVAIYARFIARGSNTTAGIIQAKGGTGGNGATVSTGNAAGGGGAGGGGGGSVYIVDEALTGNAITNAIDVSGGAGGNGGNGVGTGTGGYGGAQGRSGSVQIVTLGAGTFTSLAPNATTSISNAAPSGVTGGTGRPVTTQQANL